HARAGIDIVRPELGTHELLHEEGLLVGATARRDAAERAGTMLRLNLIELVGGVGERLVPADLAPRLVNRVSDHRVEDAILVIGIAVGEATLDAGMPAVGLAILPRDHPHELLAAHFGAESAANTAISAGRNDRALRQADRLDALFLQRICRTGLNAGAAAHAFGREEIVIGLAGADLRGESATVDGERESALDFVASTHAARADDALGRVEIEVGIGMIDGRVEVVLALVAVAHVAQANVGSLFLQLAIVVGRACETVERVVGDIEFHHALAQLLEPRSLGLDFHAGHDWCGAAGWRTARAFDLDQAQPARTE